MMLNLGMNKSNKRLLLFISFRKVLSSLSSSPTKPVIPSPARRVRITESEPSSYHDDYISRLEDLQQRLSGLESGKCYSGIKLTGSVDSVIKLPVFVNNHIKMTRFVGNEIEIL